MKTIAFFKVLLVSVILLTSAGCSFVETAPVSTPSDVTAAATPTGTPSPALSPVETATIQPATPTFAVEQDIAYGVWIPYWDYADALDEVDHLSVDLDSVICFAAIFDSNDHLLLLPDMQRALSCLNILYSDDYTVYLSVVNDLEVAQDVYDNKTTELLWRILGTDEAIDAHIEELMALLDETGAGGLEIDYEAIQSDVALWDRFVLFVERLYARLSAKGYPLRVVLGWDSAMYAVFPDGPQYSIMCYNLYGTHSGPGPKADRNFLQSVFAVNRALPGQPSIAFATGGFDWGEDGTVVSLTQSDAVAIQEGNGISTERISRDSESAVLYFSYYDLAGLSHEVWYADGETLAFWRSLALDAGYISFDLFRLGGNALTDLTVFFELSSVTN
jgi:hypothetical protein